MRIGVLFWILHIVNSSAANEKYSNLTWSSLESKLNSVVRSIVKPSLPSLLRTVSEANISSSCERGLMTYMLALQRSKIWAIEMIDATAKFHSGVLKGAVMDFGEFDECLDIRVPEITRNSSRHKENFRGRYCTIGLQSELLLSMWKKQNIPNYTDPYGEPPDLIKTSLSNLKSGIRDLQYFFGICIPSLCSEIDLHRIFAVSLKPLGVKATVVDCHVDEPYVWPVHSVVAVAVLVFLALMCAVGTTLDVMKRKHSPENEVPNNSSNVYEHILFRCLEAFSVLANSEKVMNSANESSTLCCFHGIRFLTATWIILGHTYFFSDLWGFYTYRNVFNLFEFRRYLSTAILENFTLAVDTFFFISGFFLVYSTWRQTKKNKGKLNLFKFFISKYIRMTPAICFAMTLLMLMPVIDSGPLWHSSLNPLIESCRSSWWANFLYVGNFIDPKRVCLDYTWFLATLMQFHILGVLLLMVFYRFRTLGIILGLLLVVISTVIIILQVPGVNYKILTPSAAEDIDTAFKIVSDIYIKPHFHFTCYLIGMTVAYFFMKYKEKKLCRIKQILGWCCAVCAALYSVFGFFINEDNAVFVTFYYVSYRPAWAAGFGWLTYMCCSGCGGFVNRLLSNRFLYPLGQLSYMIYLVHPLIIIYKSARQRERIYYGHSEQVFEFFSTLGPSVLLAFIGHVTVEIPFQNLHKIISEGRAAVEKVENKHTIENPVCMDNINNS